MFVFFFYLAWFVLKTYFCSTITIQNAYYQSLLFKKGENEYQVNSILWIEYFINYWLPCFLINIHLKHENSCTAELNKYLTDSYKFYIVFSAIGASKNRNMRGQRYQAKQTLSLSIG